MIGFFLFVLTFCSLENIQKEPDFIFKNYNQVKRNSFFYGNLENNNDGNLVLSHVPIGPYKKAIVYKNELVFRDPKNKVLAQKNLDKAVRIVGQVVNINGNSFILVDSMIIIDFSLEDK